jgi:hypothetical protein
MHHTTHERPRLILLAQMIGVPSPRRVAPLVEQFRRPSREGVGNRMSTAQYSDGYCIARGSPVDPGMTSAEVARKNCWVKLKLRRLSGGSGQF